MKRIAATISAFVLAASLAACGGGEAPADTAATPTADPAIQTAIEARQASLKNLGASFKTINDQVKMDAPDMAAIAGASTAISGHAAAIGGWFPAGSGPESGVKTEALATIWEDSAGFTAAVEQLQAASVTLADAVATGDSANIGPTIPVIGGSCKNCHDNYRLKKE